MSEKLFDPHSIEHNNDWVACESHNYMWKWARKKTLNIFLLYHRILFIYVHILMLHMLRVAFLIASR